MLQLDPYQRIVRFVWGNRHLPIVDIFNDAYSHDLVTWHAIPKPWPAVSADATPFAYMGDSILVGVSESTEPGRPWSPGGGFGAVAFNGACNARHGNLHRTRQDGGLMAVALTGTNEVVFDRWPVAGGDPIRTTLVGDAYTNNVAFALGTNDRVYADLQDSFNSTVLDHTGPTNRIFVSDDAGGTWTPVDFSWLYRIDGATDWGYSETTPTAYWRAEAWTEALQVAENGDLICWLDCGFEAHRRTVSGEDRSTRAYEVVARIDAIGAVTVLKTLWQSWDEERSGVIVDSGQAGVRYQNLRMRLSDGAFVLGARNAVNWDLYPADWHLNSASAPLSIPAPPHGVIVVREGGRYTYTQATTAAGATVFDRDTMTWSSVVFDRDRTLLAPFTNAPVIPAAAP